MRIRFGFVPCLHSERQAGTIRHYSEVGFSMPLLSFLSLLPVLGFVYTICFVVREERAKVLGGAALPAISFLDSTVKQGPFLGKRQIKWISMREFKALSGRSENLILIALRRKTEAKPIPFPESHILYIEPDRLIDLLQWLPPSCGAIIYGTSSCLSSIACVVRYLAGSAPIYIVCETTSHSDGPL